MLMTFVPRKGWFEEPEKLAIRLAQIIGFSDGCPPFPKKLESAKDGKPEVLDKNYWTLDASNDWWLFLKPDGVCELQYRYSWSAEQWAALQTVIEMFLSKPKED